MKDVAKTYIHSQEMFRVKNTRWKSYEKNNYDISQIGTLYDTIQGKQVIRMKTCRKNNN